MREKKKKTYFVERRNEKETLDGLITIIDHINHVENYHYKNDHFINIEMISSILII